MSEPKPAKPITPLKTGLVRLKADTTSGNADTTSANNDEKIFCDRCGGDVYRMHAVWRCVKCGYKSDCCGW
jgi:ribosomal protein L37E